MNPQKSLVRIALCSLILLVFALSPVTLLAGQGQTAPASQSITGAEIKGKAPVNRELLRVRLPRGQESRLKNGLRVVLLESRKVPTFSMQMVVLSGGLSDTADHRGLASLTATMLREGTAKRSTREISELVDTLGASLASNASLSSFTTNISTSGLVENLDEILDLFADVVRNPSFPKDEFERYKGRLLSQLQQQRSIPQFLAVERFSQVIYGQHPAGFISIPPEALARTTPEDLSKFHAGNYKPGNAILAIVGDVTMGGIIPKLEKAFGDWKGDSVPDPKLPPIPEQPGAQIHLIDRPGSVQTVFQIGNLGIERTHPDYFPLLVMDKVLGGGPAARLFRNLREDKGYTYGVYSSFSGTRFAGVWAASSAVRTEVTDEALREFFYEFRKIRDEKVPAGELDDAKRSLVGSFALSLEQPTTLLQNIVLQRLYNLPADYWDTYPEKVAAITADDVQRMALKYVNLDKLQIVAVGDASKIRGALEKYGKVQAYDSDGRPVTAPAETSQN